MSNPDFDKAIQDNHSMLDAAIQAAIRLCERDDPGTVKFVLSKLDPARWGDVAARVFEPDETLERLRATLAQAREAAPESLATYACETCGKVVTSTKGLEIHRKRLHMEIPS